MAELKVGDAVTFVAASGTANRVRLTTKSGVIKSVGGGRAVVKYSNGRESVQLLTNLTPASERSALTKMILSMGGGNEPK